MCWPAVSAISLIRWLETSTVRPSWASRCINCRIHRMPSVSKPLTGSSRSSTPGVTEQRGGDAETLTHS
jgi:hypothetical protein